MSYTFFSADIHAFHANVCAYANRPWIRIGDYRDGKWVSMAIKDEVGKNMTDALVANINGRCRKDDILIHIGDFCCNGAERGVPGHGTGAKELEDRINPRVIHILGNHDKNNGCEIGFESALMKFGGLTVFLVHRPPQSILEVPMSTNLVLCGHVHAAWRTKWMGNVLLYNVGVDANKFMPVRNDEVVGVYEYERRRKARRDDSEAQGVHGPESN